jgi:hypothetical protein
MSVVSWVDREIDGPVMDFTPMTATKFSGLAPSPLRIKAPKPV